MIDYIVLYKLKNEIKDKVFTIEDDVYIKSDKKILNQDIEFETEELTRDLLLELLKEEFESEAIQLIDFVPVNVQDNLYRFTEDDIYFDKETYI